MVIIFIQHRCFSICQTIAWLWKSSSDLSANRWKSRPLGT